MPHLRLRATILCVSFILASAQLCVRAETAREEAEAIQDKKASELVSLMALPRIPTRDELFKGKVAKENKDDEGELTKINDWVQKFMDEKKARAEKEIDAIKKKYQEEEQARSDKEKERQRRQAKLADYNDLVPIRGESNKRATITIKLDFQVT